MQYLDKKSTVTIRFKTEKDRTKGLHELYNSNVRSSCVGNHEYVVGKEHLDIFERKDIKYSIIR